MRPHNNLENKTPLDAYWRVQLVCMKVKNHSSLEPPLEYSQNQTPLTNQGPLKTILEVTEMLYSFRLVLEGKTRTRIPQALRLGFLEKFLANNFALTAAENNTSRQLNWGSIAYLPLLRTLSAIRQNSQQPTFWEVVDSCFLLAYASLTALRTLLQQLLACLNFTLDSDDLFC